MRALWTPADLLGEVLDDAVLGHLGADGEASLELLLDAGQHFLVFLRGESLHSWFNSEKTFQTIDLGEEQRPNAVNVWLRRPHRRGCRTAPRPAWTPGRAAGPRPLLLLLPRPAASS